MLQLKIIIDIVLLTIQTSFLLWLQFIRKYFAMIKSELNIRSSHNVQTYSRSSKICKYLEICLRQFYYQIYNDKLLPVD